MRRLIAIVMFSLFGIAAADAGDDPWEPSRQGKIECLRPNLAKKTCEAMTSYKWGEGGKVVAESRADFSQLVRGAVAQYQWKAEIKGDKNCSILAEQDYRTAAYEFEGKPASAEKSAEIAKSVTNQLHDYFGRTFCYEISPLADEYIVQISIDGVPYPSATTRIAWIDKDSGFTVAP